MVDAVQTIEVFKGTKKVIYKFTNESDGTGETDVTKIDISTLATAIGAPESLALSDISYDVNGFNYVVMKWSRTAQDYEIAVMKGSGGINYESSGYLQDPGHGAAGTGDILISTDGGADGSSYDITVEFKLKDA